MGGFDVDRPNSVASLTDLLTAAKNIVVALNTEAQTAANIAGTGNKAGISSSTLVSGKPGRLVNVIVTTAGSTVGSAYDASSVSTVSASNLLYSIPNTVGVYVVSVPLLYGLVITPGTSQVVTVTYS